MNVLLLGSGGREHALAWALSASPLLKSLYCAPGNAGIAEVAQCVPLDIADHSALAAFCRENRIDLVVVGPEAPLVAGVVDDLTAAGIKVFGPSRAAARLEGSKGFTKDLCREFGIPTATYARFSNAGDAKAYAARHPLPLVVKADGLAAGKGVVIAETKEDAEKAIDACFGGSFGPAGAEIVRRSSSKSSCRARRRASSRWLTASMRCLSPRPRITSAPSTVKRARIPAVWGPTHPLP